MRRDTTRKLAVAAMFIAVAVVGSMFIQFPVLGSNCSPTQHIVNILCAVLLGPGWGTAAAFVAALLRNLFHVGSPLAFPGSMCGALLCGLMYQKTGNLPLTLAGEVIGTGFLGALLAYPIAVAVMGQTPATVFVYVVPFLISTGVGSALAGILVFALKKSGALHYMQSQLRL